MAEYPLTQDELLGGDVRMLLEVTWAGRTYRWASRAVEITDADGNTLVYEGGLDAEYELAMDLFASSPVDPVVSIRELWFPDEVDVAERIEQGHPLERAGAELALWVTGRTYEQRVVLLTGTVTLSSYGSHEEPVSFDIVPHEYDDATVLPEPEAVVTDETWPNAADRSVGAAYPIPFGRPGFAADVVEGWNCGSPAHYVHTTSDTFLVADRPVYLPSGAQVLLVNTTAWDQELFDLSVTTDGLGRQVTVCDASAASTMTLDSTAEYWCRWDSDAGATVYGGIPRDDANAVMTGAGQLLLWWLRRSAIPYDAGRFAAVSDTIDAYRLSGYVDEPVSPREWLEEHVIPLLPMSLVRGPSGLYPALWRYDAGSDDAVADLVAGESLCRVGMVEYSGGEVATEISIGIKPRSDNGDPYETVTMSGRDVAGDSDQVWTTVYTRAAHSRYGTRGRVIDSLVVYTTETAARILSWMTRAYAAPWRTVGYLNTDCGWGWLLPGDVVTLTDDELHLSSRVCVVQGIRWAQETPTITLVLIDDLSRDGRA